MQLATQKHPFSRRLFRLAGGLSLAMLLTACAVAQKGAAPTAPKPTGGTGSGSNGGYGGSRSGSSGSPYNPYGNNSYNPYSTTSTIPDLDQRLEDSRVRAREADRQKRMVEDANRLVTLAARYRASVSEHGSPTMEDARLLVDMEKLARSVKERMKGM